MIDTNVGKRLRSGIGQSTFLFGSVTCALVCGASDFIYFRKATLLTEQSLTPHTTAHASHQVFIGMATDQHYHYQKLKHGSPTCFCIYRRCVFVMSHMHQYVLCTLSTYVRTTRVWAVLVWIHIMQRCTMRVRVELESNNGVVHDVEKM